ncbi:MAG: hypothetical protein Kow0092_24580 [Deferrisomatales bacterium]
MKQPPHLARAQARMAPGVLTMDGFLGPDARDLVEILEDDDGEVRRLGLTHQAIAAALERLTRKATEALGALTREGVYEVCACETRGGLPCPFGHPGLYEKTVIEARRTDTGQKLLWTVLQVHLIGAHGFYQGKGSYFRIEPAELAAFLGLEAERGD